MSKITAIPPWIIILTFILILAGFNAGNAQTEKISQVTFYVL